MVGLESFLRYYMLRSFADFRPIVQTPKEDASDFRLLVFIRLLYLTGGYNRTYYPALRQAKFYLLQRQSRQRQSR